MFYDKKSPRSPKEAIRNGKFLLSMYAWLSIGGVLTSLGMLSDNFYIQNNMKIQVFGCPGNEEYTFCITILSTERQYICSILSQKW